MSCPQPTPQYGQTERATCASSIRACIARVLSDIASKPVPSARPRICRTSGHFESNTESDVMSFNPRLSSHFHCYRFLSHRKARKSRTMIVEDLLACHRRLILRSDWTLARLQKSDQCLDLLRLKRAAERRHITSAIDDADDHIVMGQFVCDVGEIGPAATAVTLDEVTIKTSFFVKKLRALENRPACCPNNFFTERQRLEIWRPRRLLPLNPERPDHNYRQTHDRNSPWAPRRGAFSLMIQDGNNQQQQAENNRHQNHDVAFNSDRDQREKREVPEKIPVRARIGVEHAWIRRLVERGRPDEMRKQRYGQDE